MLAADFFARLGLFVYRGFLDRDWCARTRAEMQKAPTVSATVIHEKGMVVDETVRRAGLIGVSAATTSAVRERLLAVRLQLENHFQVELRDCVPPQFLLYREGDFYVAHRDNGLAKERQISIVVFVNGIDPHRQESNRYDGGTLTFYGLIDDDHRRTAIGLPLLPEEGLLIAFRSHLVHEVSPVTHGVRYTVVSWFL